MTEKIRVLVFGTVGTGKTSLCNTLSGADEAVSNQARGVTFTSKVFKPFEDKESGKSIELVDTAGLNEAESGNVPGQEAIKQLAQLLKNSEEGYNLLIQVFRASSITALEIDNYDLFVKRVANSRIPVILVVTGCELSDPMSEWREKNRIYFEKSHLIYKDIICTCFAKGDERASLGASLEAIYALLREESRRAVLTAITTYAGETVTFYDTTGQDSEMSFGKMLSRVWEFCRERLNLPLLGEMATEALVQFLINVLGFDEPAARTAVNIFKRDQTSQTSSEEDW